MRPPEPATALRSALASPWPRLVVAARAIIREAIDEAQTLGEAAESLGVSRDTLERIRADFPGMFGSSKNRKK